MSGHDIWQEHKQNQIFNGKTFSEFALATIQKITAARQWKNQKHSAQWYATIETYALPVIGQTLLETTFWRFFRQFGKQKQKPLRDCVLDLKSFSIMQFMKVYMQVQILLSGAQT